MVETLQNLSNGFALALSPSVLPYAFVGCIVGTLVGVLPGVGPLAGISLLLPISFGLNATSAIVLLAGMVVGLVVSVFQAVTQIQEMTLAFVPKVIIVFLVLLLLSPWMMGVMIGFTSKIFTGIPTYIR